MQNDAIEYSTYEENIPVSEPDLDKAIEEWVESCPETDEELPMECIVSGSDKLDPFRKGLYPQRHFTYVYSDSFLNVLKSANELAYRKDGLDGDDYESMLVGWSTLWGCARIMAASFYVLGDQRWKHVVSADQLLNICDVQTKRAAEQLKRPKRQYIRKRDKIQANPGAQYCNDRQALLSAITTLADCGWFLLTDDNQLEINPAVAAIGNNANISCHASENAMNQKERACGKHSFQLGLSPDTVEFLSYLARTSYMDFWRYIAICNAAGEVRRPLNSTDLMGLDSRFSRLFALTDKQDAANRNRGFDRSDARYWVDRYVKAKWLGHWVKRKPMKRVAKPMLGFLGHGGVQREYRPCRRGEKADYYETSTYWIINPSVASAFDFNADNFYKTIGIFFKKARSLSDECIDFLGVFHKRIRQHAHYLRWRRGKNLWNWDKYTGQKPSASRPITFKNIQDHIAAFMANIGLSQHIAQMNMALHLLM